MIATGQDGPPVDWGAATAALGSLPAALAAARRLDGLSLRAAAKGVGVPATTLREAEQGYNVSLQAALRIVAWLARRGEAAETG